MEFNFLAILIADFGNTIVGQHYNMLLFK